MDLGRNNLTNMARNLSKDIYKDYQKYLGNRPEERRSEIPKSSELPKSSKLLKAMDGSASYIKQSININVDPFVIFYF
jgi:hypothetical protein